MSANNYVVTHAGLALHEILQELESTDGDGLQRLIYVTPPDEGADTDVDSDKSDDEAEGDVNHLGRNMLRSICEVQTECKPNSDVQLHPRTNTGEPDYVVEPQPSTSRPANEDTDCDQGVEPLPGTSNRRRRIKILAKESDSKSDEGEKETQNLKMKKVRPTGKKIKLDKTTNLLTKKTLKAIAAENKQAKIDQWKTDEPDFQLDINCDPIPCSDEAMECETPLDFFSLFFSDDLLDYICKQSNLYALQKNFELNLTRDELWVLFGGLLMSGYAKYPNKRMYWSTDDDVPKLLSQSIHCNRFEQILRFLHLNDNTQNDRSDKLFKLRPYIEALNLSFKKHGGLDENLSIDESMIPYYGKHYAKQYIKGKPIRFGFKNWALCSSSGYLVTFEVYTGKDPNRVSRFGLGGDIVVKLIENAEVPTNNGHKLFIDNFFTSVPLIRFFSEIGICATGTIQEGRTEYCTLQSRKELALEDRGSYDFRTAGNVMLVRWHDNSVCTIATNCERFSFGTARRWSRTKKAKVQVPQPTVFASYNKSMGGVDLMDQNVFTYRTRMRQKKWWWPIFVYLFYVSISNSWLLNRKLLNPEKAIGQLLSFRRNLAITVLRKYGTPSSQGKSVPKPLKDVRYDKTDHWPFPNPTERRCGHCTGKAKFICTKCNIGLHPKCFMEYHRQQ